MIALQEGAGVEINQPVIDVWFRDGVSIYL